MASAGNRFYNEDVGHADMVEAPRRVPQSKSKGVLMGLAVSVALLLLVIVLIRGSLPAMTPEQIVQQKEYQGEQPPRHIFNLYSLKQDKQRRELESSRDSDQSDLNLQISVSSAATVGKSTEYIESKQGVSSSVETGGQVVVKPDVTTIYEKADLKRERILPVVSKPASVAPDASASATITEPLILAVSKPAQTVELPQTAEGVKPTVAKNDQQSITVVESKAPMPLNDLTELPVRTIELNNSRLRSRPAFDAEVIEMLKKGQSITVFARVGEWTQVATNDGTGTTGYVHSSLLGVNDPGR